MCPKCGATRPGAKIWPWVIGVPLALLLALVLYGLTIPEYEARALEVRNMCEQLVPFQKEECRRQYDEAVRKGREEARR